MVQRRQWILGGAGTLAVALGAGVAWRTASHEHLADAVMGAAEQALWASEFDAPDGQRFAMQSLRGKPLLLNFWATWCPPCIEEFPLLDSFFQKKSPKNIQVLGLAIDQPSAVRSFLLKTPVTFPVLLGGIGGTELGRTLGNLTGGLPFSVLLGSSGAILQRKLGKLTPAELEQWASIC